MYVKLYLKTLAPSTVRWFPRGASTMLKITKDIKGKEDYLQIGVTQMLWLDGVTIYFKYI